MRFEFFIRLVLGACALGIFQGDGRAHAGPVDDGADLLKDPKLWLEMASTDALRLKYDERSDPVELFVYVGDAQARAGDSPGALETAGKLMEQSARAPTPTVAAVDQLAAASIRISAKAPRQAEIVLDRLEKETLGKLHGRAAGVFRFGENLDLDWVVGCIAVQRARLGENERALSLVAKIESAGGRAEAYCDLADMFYQLEQPAEAKRSLDLATQLLDHSSASRDFVQRAIFQVLMGAGEFDEAMKRAKAQKYNSNPVDDLTSALSWRFRDGPTESSRPLVHRACAYLEKLSVAKPEANEIANLARAEAELGEVEGAVRMLKRFDSLLDKVPPKERGYFLQIKGIVHARAGDLTSFHNDFVSLVALDSSKDANPQAGYERLYFRDLAGAMAAAGKFDEAMEFAAKSGFPTSYCPVAVEIARSGNLARAWETLQMYKGWSYEDLRRVIAAYAADGDLVALKKWVDSNKDPWARGYAELAAAQGLMKKSDSTLYLRHPPADTSSDAVIGVGPGGGFGTGGAPGDK
jgi:tetratricopeptide (TPR) repeat protein